MAAMSDLRQARSAHAVFRQPGVYVPDPANRPDAGPNASFQKWSAVQLFHWKRAADSIRIQDICGFKCVSTQQATPIKSN
jgi:hypothetical protein